jgi:hypothetical protein
VTLAPGATEVGETDITVVVGVRPVVPKSHAPMSQLLTVRVWELLEEFWA